MLVTEKTYTTDCRDPPRPWTDVSFSQLMSYVESKQASLFDVRSKEEVEETGMIPTAVNIPCM